MQAEADILMSEAAALLDEARQERDSARAEAADLRAALMAAQAPTSTALLSRLLLSGLPDNHRLMVMCQNPSANYHWSKVVGQMTAGEVRAALAKVEA